MQRQPLPPLPPLHPLHPPQLLPLTTQPQVPLLVHRQLLRSHNWLLTSASPLERTLMALVTAMVPSMVQMANPSKSLVLAHQIATRSLL